MCQRFHIQVHNVKGLNMGKDMFFWNDKLMFKDAGTKHGNIAEVHIFIDRPSPEIDLFSIESGTFILNTIQSYIDMYVNFNCLIFFIFSYLERDDQHLHGLIKDDHI